MNLLKNCIAVKHGDCQCDFNTVIIYSAFEEMGQCISYLDLKKAYDDGLIEVFSQHFPGVVDNHKDCQ
jgi:hypothetical protein